MRDPINQVQRKIAGESTPSTPSTRTAAEQVEKIEPIKHHPLASSFAIEYLARLSVATHGACTCTIPWSGMAPTDHTAEFKAASVILEMLAEAMNLAELGRHVPRVFQELHKMAYAAITDPASIDPHDWGDHGTLAKLEHAHDDAWRAQCQM